MENNNAQGGENLNMTKLIYVTPAVEAYETAKRTKASHIITLMQDEAMSDLPSRVDLYNYLHLDLADVLRSTPRWRAATPSQIVQLVRFVREWSKNSHAPLVVHCHAGRSRSPAAAYIALCSLNPQVSEKRIVEVMKAASSDLSPNMRMIALADKILKRDGRMFEAAKRWKPSLRKGENLTFFLPSVLSPAQERA